MFQRSCQISNLSEHSGVESDWSRESIVRRVPPMLVAVLLGVPVSLPVAAQDGIPVDLSRWSMEEYASGEE